MVDLSIAMLNNQRVNPPSDFRDFLPRRPLRRKRRERGAVDGIPTDRDPLPSRLQGLRGNDEVHGKGPMRIWNRKSRITGIYLHKQCGNPGFHKQIDNVEMFMGNSTGIIGIDMGYSYGMSMKTLLK